MRFFFTSAILHFCTAAVAQSMSLPGSVVIQNSEYETGHRQYVSDASIRAPFAKAITTDKDGQFALAFAGMESGTPVRLTVSRPGLEVVNSKETDHVIIGRTPRINVVMADPDKLAAAQVKYYNIATGSISSTYGKRMGALRAESLTLAERLAKVNEETGQSTISLSAAIDALTAQRDAAMQQAQEVARQFAEVNLDDASTLYRTAFELFRRGEIDSVLHMLNEQKLNADLASAVGKRSHGAAIIAKANVAIRQLYQCHEMKAIVLLTGLRYRAALDVHRAMQRMIAEQPDVFEPGTDVRLLRSIGRLLRTTGDYAGSVEALKDALVKGVVANAVSEGELASIHSDLGAALADKGEHEAAITEATMGIDMNTRFSGPDAVATGEAWSSRAEVHIQNSEYAPALADMQEALRIIQAAEGPDDVRTGEAQRLTAQSFSALDRYPEALEHFAEAIRILPPKLGEYHPDVAAMWLSYGMALCAQDSVKIGTQAVQRSLRIQVRTLGAEHPETIHAYHYLAAIRLHYGDADGALLYMDSALVIGEKAFGDEHQDVVMLRNYRATALMVARRYDEALAEMRHSLRVQLKNMGPDNEDVAGIYGNMAETFGKMGSLDSALIYHERSKAIIVKTQGPNSRSYSNSMMSVGRILLLKGEREQALDLFRQSLAIRIKVFGPMNYNIANVHDYIGSAFFGMDKLDSALSHFNEGLRIRTGTKPPGHEDFAKSWWHIGAVYYKMGDRAKARAALDSSFHIHPNAEAGWYLFRIARDEGNLDSALVWLLPCARERVEDPATPKKTVDETMAAMKDLAGKLHRKDLLEEFHLN